MKKHFHLISLVVLIISISCTSHKTINIEQNKLQVIDSLVINSEFAILADVTLKKLLFYNIFNNDIIVYDRDTRTSSIFNKNGDSGEEYSKLAPGSIKVIGDNIAVGGIKDIKYYDFKGNYIKSIKVDNRNSYAAIESQYLLNNGSTIILNKPQGDTGKIEFYKEGHIIFEVIDSTSNNSYKFGTFPEKNSDIYTNEWRRSFPYDFFVKVDESKNRVSYLNSNDRNIFTYNISSGKLIKQTPLTLPKYNPIEIKFGEKLELGISRERLYTNSRIECFDVLNDTIYTVYSIPVDKDIVKDKIKKNETINKRYVLDIQYNDKIVKEYFFKSDEEGYPMKMYNNILYLKKVSNEIDEKRGTSTYYIARI